MLIIMFSVFNHLKIMCFHYFTVSILYVPNYSLMELLMLLLTLSLVN